MNKKHKVSESQKLIKQLISKTRDHKDLLKRSLALAIEIEALENKISCDADLVLKLKNGGVHDWKHDILSIEDGKFHLIEDGKPGAKSTFISLLNQQ